MFFDDISMVGVNRTKVMNLMTSIWNNLENINNIELSSHGII